MRVRAPERAGRAAGTGEPIDCWFVRIWEQDPPEGVEPLEWVLYTDWPTESFSDAIMVVMDYATRFLIEEFHKGIKTGMKAEDLQLERGNRLFAAIAVMSVVALRLLDLRELGKGFPEAPAACTGLDKLELEVLGLAVKRELKTVTDVLLALGRLGGHMNRRRDGMPGWITLWRGMKVLRLVVRGAKLERENQCTCTLVGKNACTQFSGNDKAQTVGTRTQSAGTRTQSAGTRRIGYGRSPGVHGCPQSHPVRYHNACIVAIQASFSWWIPSRTGFEPNSLTGRPPVACMQSADRPGAAMLAI